MKRIIALLLTLVIALCASACSVNVNVGSSYTEPTEETEPEPTEAPTKAPTEPPTEAPTAAPKPTPTQPANAFYYTSPSGHWRVTVPNQWKKTGKIVEYIKDSVYTAQFVHRGAYAKGAGHIFTIVTVEGTKNFVNVSQYPHAETIIKTGGVQVYVIYPTDVQFGVGVKAGSAAYKQQQREYQALANTRQSILDSFDWIK